MLRRLLPADEARKFVYVHAGYYLDRFGIQIAARKTLDRIAEFNARPPQKRPPIMNSPAWGQILAELRVLAGDPAPRSARIKGRRSGNG